MNSRKNEGGIAAVLKFSGKPTENMVQNKAKELRQCLKKDGLKPINNSCLLARYNNSYRTWSFLMVSFCVFSSKSYIYIFFLFSYFKWK